MEFEETWKKMAPTRVILMSCGSYNPPTDMHLRMFELARDHLHRMGTHVVVGGVISPTHDDYAKTDLASAEHRCAMLKLATRNSDWIRVSTWEARQNGWTKTRLSLQHHQNLLNSILLDTNDVKHCRDTADTDWIPERVKNGADVSPVQIKLLCGADLLESFGTPGLWADEDIDAIVGQHGLVVITREGSNPHKFIYESDILSKYMHNIHIVINWIRHEVSSTKIRKAFRRGDSVKYEVQDAVIDYVYKNGLYGAKTVSTIKLELSSKNSNNDYLNIQPKYQTAFLTPSPSDVTMTTPSPVENISIDISESVFRMNMQNSSIPTNVRSANVDDTERMRDKFIDVITENGNKLLASNKAAYPGQAKQIIATETGESQIFREVGQSSISENSNTENSNTEITTIDDKSDDPIVDKTVLDSPRKNDRSGDAFQTLEKSNKIDDPSPSEVAENLRPSDRTSPPEDSETKVFVIIRTDVVDADDAESVPKIFEHPIFTDEKRKTVESADFIKSRKNGNNDDEGNPIAVISKPSTSRCNDVFDIPEDESTNDLKSVAESETAIDGNAENSSLERSDVSSVELKKKNSVEREQTVESASRSNSDVVEDIGSTLKESMSVESDDGDAKPNEGPSTEKDPSGGESTAESESSKRDANVEIDGKYIKSLVNSRKSPKRTKPNDDQERTSTVVSHTVDDSREAELPEIGETGAEKSSVDGPKAGSRDVRDAVESKITKSSLKSNGRKRGVLFQGSLDSINVTRIKSSDAVTRHELISKKSKSYEFIKQTEIQPSTIYKIPSADLKSDGDSASIFVTADDSKNPPTDEFCSVCCYANDPSSTEVFFTLRSTASSPLEEDSTECDICSNCDLRENGESGNLKDADKSTPVDGRCEVCEICGDRAMDEDVVASSRPEKDDFVDRRLLASRPLPLSLPKNTNAVGRIDSRTFAADSDDDDDDGAKSKTTDREIRAGTADVVPPLRSKSIDEQSTDNTNSNDDEFEIENCGLDVDLNFEKTNETGSRYKAEVEDTFRNSVPRDEVAMSGKTVNKMIRAGSLVSRDTVDRSKGKRRYSSVDNLQNSRQVVRSTCEKQSSLRSRNVVKALVASADNIRPARSSRSRSLRKSADDLGSVRNSSMDDHPEGPVYENIRAKKFDEKDEGLKPRENGTIKMILTKHGIQIMSDKETAL